ncbi:DUF3459 domain-containing protein [Fibrella aquatica]|jgi:maltooligosyltrehalose trehalohydrolase|uniref:DUF3459 domain-containing protein n=1 Tax=Fibrella aquatica TaxID=3242487 RepID=UPI003521CC9F
MIQPHTQSFRSETKDDFQEAAVTLESLKLLAGSLLVSPHIPTLFTGNVSDDLHAYDSQTQLLKAYYKALNELRRQEPALHDMSRKLVALIPPDNENVLFLHRWVGSQHLLCLLNFTAMKQEVHLPAMGMDWHKSIDSAAPCWNGPEAAPNFIADAERIVLQPESIIIYKCCD